MFRTVLIKKASKLQYIQGYLVIYDGDIERKVFLSDISILMIEATGSIITFPLLIELVKHNVTVIFCDEKHSPFGTILGLSNNYKNYGNIEKQLEWKEETIEIFWKLIVEQKIYMQSCVLKMFNKDNKNNILDDYCKGVQLLDKTNREGLAAKVYFAELFGKNFNRSEQSLINSLLDYGYTILLTCFNREIVSSGYLTQLGIFHKGKTNPYNLSSDFMEPFRPVVDILVMVNFKENDPLKRIRKLLTKKIIINDEERYMDDAIRVYTNQLIRYLNHETKFLPVMKLKKLEHYSYDESNEINNNV